MKIVKVHFPKTLCKEGIIFSVHTVTSIVLFYFYKMPERSLNLFLVHMKSLITISTR